MGLPDLPPNQSSAAGRESQISVRASSGGYWAALFLLTFAAVLFWRLEHANAALVIIVSAWTVMPILAFTDRVTFDGTALRRRGLFAFLSNSIFQREASLPVDE